MRELGEMKPKCLFHEELSQLMELLDLDAFSIYFFFLLLLSSKSISAFKGVTCWYSTACLHFYFYFFSGWHKLLLLSSQLLRDAIAGLVWCSCFGGRCDEISALVAEVDARARSAQTPEGGVWVFMGLVLMEMLVNNCDSLDDAGGFGSWIFPRRLVV